MKTIIYNIGDYTYTIYIGQNAKENWNLIDNSDSFDLWFHLKNDPSSHVIISQDISKNNDLFYSNEIIMLAGNYCKNYSKLKSNKKHDIIYTEIKNIKKGKHIGSVITSNEKYFTLT